jgi:ketosteroid isomerase-like protein
MEEAVTTLAALKEWTDRYERAWRANDAGQVAGLFTDDAVHRWHPWETPEQGARGRDDIVEQWLKDPDDPSSWTMEFEPVAVNGDLGVVRGITRYAAAEGKPARTFHNVFLVRLADDGRCSDFVEYYMEQPAASG